MIDNVKSRVQTRLTGETYDPAMLDELTQTVTDRVCLRCGLDSETSVPRILQSIIVDATIKAFRRISYEGIAEERVGGLVDNFLPDILAEYAAEIDAWRDAHADEDDLTGKTVRFY